MHVIADHTPHKERRKWELNRGRERQSQKEREHKESILLMNEIGLLSLKLTFILNINKEKLVI